MAGRSRRKTVRHEAGELVGKPAPRAPGLADFNHRCWLCGRELGKRVQWHHAVPRSRGGKDTVPVHPICHSTLHASFTNHELEQYGTDIGSLRSTPEMTLFLRWIDGKPPDFHAPTRRRKQDAR